VLLLDIIGYIAYALVFFGVWRIGKRSRNGWLWKGAGDGCWVLLGYSLGLSSIVLMELGMLISDLYFYREWNETAEQKD
jgi:hypothetical protein